jgi:predicted acyl esterase
LPEGKAAEMVFDLLPTARHFPIGSRIRLAVACADKDNCRSAQRSPAPAVTVLRDAQHASRVLLPIVKE